RFFVTQSYFVLLYIIFVWLIWYISGDKLFNSNKNPLSGLGTNLILSSFTIVCAFVHLPLREKDLSQYSIYRNEYEDSGFSLKVARLMCHLSWQAYGIPKGIETDNPNEYPVNLEDSSLNLYEIGQSKDYDVQWLIAEGKGIVTVAFRGSISFVNVTTNLRIYHRLVNNNFWFLVSINCNFLVHRRPPFHQPIATENATWLHDGPRWLPPIIFGRQKKCLQVFERARPRQKQRDHFLFHGAQPRRCSRYSVLSRNPLQNGL
ncbi:hypothetical protein MHBO_001865, partial [Bonamia ostreae]